MPLDFFLIKKKLYKITAYIKFDLVAHQSRNKLINVAPTCTTKPELNKYLYITYFIVFEYIKCDKIFALWVSFDRKYYV